MALLGMVPDQNRLTERNDLRDLSRAAQSRVAFTSQAIGACAQALNPRLLPFLEVVSS
jgi:hypothetical protein